jgi:hypothetical protein
MQRAVESEPRFDSPPPYDPTIWQMCDEVLAVAPAFVRSEVTDYAYAEFVDYFAMVMLHEHSG